jgi:hypothetical protein
MALKAGFNAVMKKGVFANSDAGVLKRLYDPQALDGHKSYEKAKGLVDARKSTMDQTKARIDEARTVITDNRKMQEGLDKNSDDFKALQGGIADQEAVIKAQTKAQGDVGFWKTYGGVAKQGFHAMNEGTGAQIATKWGAVGAGYLAVNGMGRAATGGGATYNSSGQRDIMGVPLI